MQSSDAYFKNIWKYKVYVVISGLTTLGPLCNLFYLSTGIEFYQLSLIETFSLIVLIAIEVPAGVISDFIGRTKSMALGCFLMGGEYLMIGLGYSFSVFVLAALIGGIGISLESGADDSLLYESLKKLGKEKQFKKYLGQSNALFKVSAAIAALLGGILFSYQASWVFFLYGAMLVGLGFFALTMKETVTRKPASIAGKCKTSAVNVNPRWGNLNVWKLAVIGHIATCRQLFQQKYWLVAAIVFSAVVITLIRAHATLLRPSLLMQYLPEVSWLGVITAIGLGVSSIVSWYGHLLLAITNTRTFLFVHALLVALIFICFGAFSALALPGGVSIHFVSIAVFFLVGLLFIICAINSIFWGDFWHQHFSGKVRATLLSFKSACYSLVAIITLNSTGALADTIGLSQASIVLGVTLIAMIVTVTVGRYLLRYISRYSVNLTNKSITEIPTRSLAKSVSK